jgi:hypothetical protein
MSWIFLFFAGLLEIVWAVAMKQSAGFTRLTPTLIMAAAMPAIRDAQRALAEQQQQRRDHDAPRRAGDAPRIGSR